ncbi:hypothetical protein WI665_19220 [Vibrio cholerae]
MPAENRCGEISADDGLGEGRYDGVWSVMWKAPAADGADRNARRDRRTDNATVSGMPVVGNAAAAGRPCACRLALTAKQAGRSGDETCARGKCEMNARMPRACVKKRMPQADNDAALNHRRFWSPSGDERTDALTC